MLTTFTKNLALDIEGNLRSFCSPETLRRIEVRNLYAWVHGFLRRRKYEHAIVYGRSAGEARQAWQRALTLKDSALGLADEFYADEFDHVVLAQGITSREGYRSARRAGRGTLLSRSKRDAMWPVFEEYRSQLSLRKLKEADDAFRDAAAMLERDGNAGYSAIVIDETQDFGPQALRLLRAMVAPGRNDLFFVGDGHQRIYPRNRAAMSRCGIDIRGRSRKLYLNYRTTEEIRKRAVALLEGVDIDDLDEGLDELVRYKSLTHGPAPESIDCATVDEAVERGVAIGTAWRAEVDGDSAATTAVMAGSGALRDLIARKLGVGGRRTAVIDDSTATASILR